MRNESVIILSPHDTVRATLSRIVSDAGYSTQLTPAPGVLLAVDRSELQDVRFEKAALPTLEDVERLYIEHVVTGTSYNISQAARILGIDRTTLYNKLRRYGLMRRKTASGE